MVEAMAAALLMSLSMAIDLVGGVGVVAGVDHYPSLPCKGCRRRRRRRRRSRVRD